MARQALTLALDELSPACDVSKRRRVWHGRGTRRESLQISHDHPCLLLCEVERRHGCAGDALADDAAHLIVGSGPAKFPRHQRDPLDLIAARPMTTRAVALE